MRKMVISFLVAALVAFVAGDSWAGKGGNGGGGNGGGGGGGDPVPAGTIYGDGVAIDAAGNVLDDTLPLGQPSYATHAGSRWFAWYEDNGNGDVRLLATREDGTEFDLTPTTSSETMIFYDLIRWAHDDSALYYVAVVWFGSGQFDADSHVFRLPLDWSTGAPVASGAPVSVAEDGVTTDAGPYPLFGKFDVSPDGAKLVYEDSSNSVGNIYVETIATGARTLLASAPVQDPAWSPDGAYIAYQVSNGTGLVTVKPDGSDATTYEPKGSRLYLAPRWSPDSAHLAFLERSGRSGSTYHTGRLKVATGDVTILDPGLTPAGWR